MDSYVLDLHLTVTGGFFGSLGKLRLYCWLKAVRLPGTAGQGALTAVYPSADDSPRVRELTLAPGDVGPLLSLVRDLCFPERRPHVQEIFDTSDVWEHVIFRMTLNDDTRTLELALCGSGFEGTDAEGLRRVFRRLLDLAGLSDLGDWYNLTGRRPNRSK